MPRTAFKKTIKSAINFETLEEVSEEVEQNLSKTSPLNAKQFPQDKSKPEGNTFDCYL